MDSSAEQRRRAVVAGVDASPAATAVVRFAAEEAAARGIALHLVHVVPWPNPGAAWTSCADRVWVDGLRGEAEELLDAAAARVAGTVPPERIHRTVGFGDPVAELVQASTGADLLVVGPRGTGGVTGMIIGSTATGVAAHARCAVVVLPGGAAADRTDRKRVVAGVAGAEGDDAVLSFALAEARLRQTDLVAVHAWQDPVTDSGYRSAGRLVDWTGPEAEEQRVLAEALAGLRREEPDVAVRELVVRSRVSPALLEAGRDAELLVVGRRDHGLLGRLGSAGHAVLHRAGCPVALVPVPAGAPR